MKRLWRHTRVVAAKELRDGFRDRRSLVSAFLVPLVGPLLIAVMFTMLAKEQADDRPVVLAVVGAEFAPAVIDHLERSGIDVEESQASPETLEAQVEAGDLDVVLVVDEKFGSRFREARRAPLQLIVDSSRRESSAPIRKVERALEGYAAKVGTLRLLARGVDPQVVRALDVQTLDTATSQRHAANLMIMVPMFVMLAAFVGGMFIATDSTAGERERRSMEPLLINPVSRVSLVVGKWLAASTFSAVGLTITLIGSLVAMRQVPLEDLGMTASLGWPEGLGLAAGLLPIAFLATGTQLLVASFAKSFREAQTYLSMLTLAPTMPAVFLSIKPMAAQAWMSVVPILGQLTLLLEVLRGEPTQVWGFVVAGVVAVLCGAVAVWATIRLFEGGRMLTS